MSRKNFPSSILEQAINIQDAWARIDEQLTVGGKGIGELVTEINQIRQLEANLVSLENQITEIRNRRDDLCQSAWDKVRRFRAMIKGMFGFDSTQYELAGGKRASERKAARRSAPPAE